MSVSPRATALLTAARSRSGPPSHTPVDAPVDVTDDATTEVLEVLDPAPRIRRRIGMQEGRPAAGGSGDSDARSHPIDAPSRPSEVPSRRLVRARDGVLQVPQGLSGARVSPPWAAVVGAFLVVLAAVVVVALTVLGEGDAAEPVPTRATPAATAPEAVSFSGTAPATAPPVAAASPMAPAPDLVVHVVGEVKKAGVVRVPAGSRVQDAITEAGGPTGKAVLSGVNLARPVVDGEQITVPDAEGAPVPVNTMPVPTGAASGPTAQIDLNSADQATLETLPGVGPVLAGRIVEWRTAHGRFTSVDELGEVSGVGEKKLESLRPHVRV